MNSQIILRAVIIVNEVSVPSSSDYLWKRSTVLNRIIHTASLVIPSPKMTEKSFGCDTGFNRDIAAIVSVEHKRELISKISIIERFRRVVSCVSPLIWKTASFAITIV